MIVTYAAESNLKRVTLELGGNDAAIVLDDADPAAVAQGLFDGAFANNGQVCCAIKRAYVPESMYDEVAEALAARAAAAKVGEARSLRSAGSRHSGRAGRRFSASPAARATLR